MKPALAQINTTVGDFDGNPRCCAAYERGVRRRGTGGGPELAMTGYHLGIFC